MRIAMFEDTYWPKIDGINTSVELFSKELRKRGHEVVIIAPMHPGADYAECPIVDDDRILLPSVGTDWLYPGTSLGKFWRGMGSGPVAERFQTWKPDILHSHTEFTIGLWMASYWRSRLNAKRVHTYHTLWTEYLFYLPLPEAFSQPLVRYLAPRTTKKRFDGVIAPTEKMREALIADWGITPEWSHIDVVPTGIDVARMQHGDNARFRAKYGIADDESVILYLGRIGTEKNVELVIKTFAELRRRGEEKVRFVVAGGGPEQYVAKLKQQAVAMGVENIIWTGFVRGQDWLDTYAAADVVLFPSVTETQGLVVVEALAAGVPLVSVEAMGPASTMKGERGCLFAGNDPAQFATSTQRLLRDEVLYERKKREALEIAKVSSVEHRTDELVGVYERVLGQAPAAAPGPSSKSSRKVG
jgi:glycosyltransferase involved in cell wall biosynthesis